MAHALHDGASSVLGLVAVRDPGDADHDVLRFAGERFPVRQGPARRRVAQVFRILEGGPRGAVFQLWKLVDGVAAMEKVGPG